jgi:DNA-binding Xre family transcriptional regulator
VCSDRSMPFYSSYTSCRRLVNKLKHILDARGMSSFMLSRVTELSPTTTRKIYYDSEYIPSPDVLERICISLDIQPGDILQITPKLETSVAVCSGVLSPGL